MYLWWIGRNSIQIEINRRLYMDETTLSKRPGFVDTVGVMRRLTRALRDLSASL